MNRQIRLSSQSIRESSLAIVTCCFQIHQVCRECAGDFRQKLTHNMQISISSYFRIIHGRFQMTPAKSEHLRRYIAYYLLEMKRHFSLFNIQIPIGQLNIGINNYDGNEDPHSLLLYINTSFNMLPALLKKKIQDRNKWNKRRYGAVMISSSGRPPLQISRNEYDIIKQSFVNLLMEIIGTLINSYHVPLSLGE